MTWTEIIAGLRSVVDKPDVLWSGLGTEVLFTLLGLAGAGALWFLARLFKKKTASDRQNTDDWFSKNRHKLLVRLQWELDERNKFLLLGQTTLHLDKDLSPDEVHHPHTRQDSICCTLERDGKEVETTDQPIVDLFLRPDVGQRLAILGKPGSGKTVCLLKLLEYLLQQAEGDAHEPLPIIFECSEWDGRELMPWMAYQLHRKYEIQEDTARQMVQSRDVLPLFDGLDELAAEKQGDFVRRFNALPNDRPQIVCCRIKEYEYLQENAGDKLALRNAVILRDIAPQCLKEHLLRAGLDDLWTLLEQSENEADPSSPQPAEEEQDTEQPQTLPELARRPLFLGIMIAVAEKLRQGWKRQQGETWEDSLWRAYLSDCLATRQPKPKKRQPQQKQEPDAHDRKYTKDKSLHWLHCLARWMQAENKVALQLDELQPSMLEGYWRFGLFYGLFPAVIYGMALGIFWDPVFGLAIGISSGLLFALPGSLTLEEDVKILVGLAWGVSALLIEGPLACLIVAFIFIRIMGNEPCKISPIIALHRPTSCRKGQTFISLSLASLGYGLVMGIYSGTIIGLVHMRGISMGVWLAFTLAFVPAVFSLIGVAYALRMIAGPVRKTTYPQERLNDALYNSFALFPLFNLAAILFFLQILSLAEQLNVPVRVFHNMSLFYTVLLMFAVLSFLVLGTNTIFQHSLLRLCLRIERQLPLRLVSWLNLMHQRKVFQRVGGSYHFLHKQLQEYLAKQQAL